MYITQIPLQLDNFFANPSWLGLIAIFMIVSGAVFVVWLRKERKYDRLHTSQNTETTVTAIDKLNASLQMLLEKEKNTLSRQSAEEMIAATLRQAENDVKTETVRIFYHNHRDNPKRQVIIRKAIESVVKTAYDNIINSLGKLTYKEKKLNEFMINFDIDVFNDTLFDHVFDKGESDKTDLQDTLYFIETYFTSMITNAKSYFSN